MKPLSLLLVEDNEDDEFLALRVLRRAGLETVMVARDGQAALDMLFDENRSLPGMVLLDIRLPKIDGLRVLATLRQHGRTKDLPVVILSSSEDPLEREKSFKLGVLAYLNKPLESGDLERVCGASAG